MTEKQIVDIIGKDRVLSGHKIVCGNVNYLFHGQQDLISVTGRGFVVEYEIKVSRGDFFRDKKKVKYQRNELLKNNQLYQAEEWDIKKTPNQFYYVVPIGLVESEEVPEWAGLIYITDKEIMFVKKAAPSFINKSMI